MAMWATEEDAEREKRRGLLRILVFLIVFVALMLVFVQMVCAGHLFARAFVYLTGVHDCARLLFVFQKWGIFMSAPIPKTVNNWLK